MVNFVSNHKDMKPLTYKRLIKNVVCSYKWSRVDAQHSLAGSVKVELSSSPPARLKEPALEPGSFNLRKVNGL